MTTRVAAHESERSINSLRHRAERIICSAAEDIIHHRAWVDAAEAEGNDYGADWHRGQAEKAVVYAATELADMMASGWLLTAR